jgi:NitT/TauT family transport system permease protein
VVVLAAWEVIIRVFHVSKLTIVSPSEIAIAFKNDVVDGSLQHNLSISMTQFSLGFLAAAGVAIPLGLWLGESRRARQYSDPWLVGLYSTPSVALAPLFIVTLGFGLGAHVSVIALTAFFPIVINTMDGVLAVDRTLREVGVAFRANKREAFLRIALPASLPYIFTGLRLGLARGLVGVVVADLFGATGGIGYQILNAAQAFNTAEVFVGVAVLAGFGIFFTVVLKYVQHRLTPWSEVHGH